MKKTDVYIAEKQYIDKIAISAASRNLNKREKISFDELDLSLAFDFGVDWFKQALFHKTKEEVPQIYGKYKNDTYPQIPCLVKGYLSTGYGYGVRYWNVTEQCWDDESCDDYECNKDAVEEWAYLDDITEELEDD